MRKTVFLFFLISVVSFPVLGDSAQDFNSTVDFSVTFGDLYDLYQQGGTVDPDKFVIIDGSIASIVVLNKDEAGFLAELELVNGRWKGLEDVEVHICSLLLKGPEFFKRIPVRRSREKLPEEIELNSRVLIVGRVVSSKVNSAKEVIPIIEVLYLRDI